MADCSDCTRIIGNEYSPSRTPRQTGRPTRCAIARGDENVAPRLQRRVVTDAPPRPGGRWPPTRSRGER
eukprot:4060312-Lingulodinium_polyedra.AAC.1